MNDINENIELLFDSICKNYDINKCDLNKLWKENIDKTREDCQDIRSMKVIDSKEICKSSSSQDILPDTCKYVFARGKKKGIRCNKRISKSMKYTCCIHKKYEEKYLDLSRDKSSGGPISSKNVNKDNVENKDVKCKNN